MKKLFLALFSGLLLLVACNEEPAIEPSADFTTSLDGNTAYAGETFYVYLDNCQGDFFAIYRGLTPSTTYSDTSTSEGTNINTDTDSVAVTYSAAGEYKLTFIASSSGNWAEEYKSDIKSININVLDERAGLVSLTVGLQEGQITSENEVLFYAHKNEDISNERVKFITASSEAKVYVDGEEVSSGRFRLDFSAETPGADEGRPQVFTVEAPSGETEQYTAKFILRDPSSDKQLFNLSSGDLDAEFTIDEENKEVIVSYYEGAELEGGLLAEASPGAMVMADGEEIQEDEETVNLEETSEITVIAEDLSEQDYTVTLYEKEKITAYNFTAFVQESDTVAISPVLQGDVDFDAKTIDLVVPKSLDLSAVVASFEGITDFSLKIESTSLVSGETAYDYSFEEGETSKDFSLEVYDGSTLIDTYTLSVHY